MAAEPTSAHTARYRPGQSESHEDGRLLSPVFARNAPPLIAALARLLGERRGTALEIGAGTGQHAAAFALAFPGLTWQASDPDPVHRASISAWAAELRAPAPPPLDLDAAADWAAEVAGLAPFQAILAVNVAHIAPFAATEGIFAGAGRTLAPGGLLLLYGPFREGGVFAGEGNRTFDARLRAENPAWGLRDTDDLAPLAARAGLGAHARIEMPANNLLLAWARPPL